MVAAGHLGGLLWGLVCTGLVRIGLHKAPEAVEAESRQGRGGDGGMSKWRPRA